MPTETTTIPALDPWRSPREQAPLITRHVEDMVRRGYALPAHVEVQCHHDYDLPNEALRWQVTMRNTQTGNVRAFIPEVAIDGTVIHVEMPAFAAVEWAQFIAPAARPRFTLDPETFRMQVQTPQLGGADRAVMADRRRRMGMEGIEISYNSPGVMIVNGQPMGPPVRARLDATNPAHHVAVDLILRQWEGNWPRQTSREVALTPELLREFGRLGFVEQAVASEWAPRLISLPEQARHVPPPPPPTFGPPKSLRMPRLHETKDQLRLAARSRRRLTVEDEASVPAKAPEAAPVKRTRVRPVRLTDEPTVQLPSVSARAEVIVRLYAEGDYEEADDLLQRTGVYVEDLRAVLDHIHSIQHTDPDDWRKAAAREILYAVEPIYRRLAAGEPMRTVVNRRRWLQIDAAPDNPAWPLPTAGDDPDARVRATPDGPEISFHMGGQDYAVTPLPGWSNRYRVRRGDGQEQILVGTLAGTTLTFRDENPSERAQREAEETINRRRSQETAQQVYGTFRASEAGRSYARVLDDYYGAHNVTLTSSAPEPNPAPTWAEQQRQLLGEQRHRGNFTPDPRQANEEARRRERAMRNRR